MRFLLVVALFAISSGTAIAEPSTPPAATHDESSNVAPGSDLKSWALHFLVLETSAAGLSYLASQNPEPYGNVWMFGAPVFSLAAGRDWKSYLGALASFVGYGAWNRSMTGEEENVIFRNNMIFLNAIPIAALTAMALFDDKEDKTGGQIQEARSSWAFSAGRRSGAVIYSWKF